MTHTVEHFDFTKDNIQIYPYINSSVLDKLVDQYENHVEFNTDPLFCFTSNYGEHHCRKILAWLLSEISEKQFDSLIDKKIINVEELLYIFILIISSYKYECFDDKNEETYIWAIIKRVISRMSINQLNQRFKLSGYSKQMKKWITEEFNTFTYLTTVALYFTEYLKIESLCNEFADVFKDLHARTDDFKDKIDKKEFYKLL